MSALVPSAAWCIASALLCLAFVKIQYVARHTEFHEAMPWLLRAAQMLGLQILPSLPRWWTSEYIRHWADTLDRDLRLSGLAQRIAALDWMRVLCGLGLGTLGVTLSAQWLSGTRASAWSAVAAANMAAGLVVLLGQRWLRQRRSERESALLREVPMGLELIALSLECGCALTAALDLAACHLPKGPMRDVLQVLHADLAGGRSRSSALRRIFETHEGSVLAPTLGTLVQADAAGSSLAPVLRAQAMQRNEERFAAAEKAALQAPVKMLLPLITCIFPCTFVVIAFPLVTRFTQ